MLILKKDWQASPEVLELVEVLLPGQAGSFEGDFVLESLANRCPDITHAFVGLQL